MIDALIAGKIHGQPAQRTSKAGKLRRIASGYLLAAPGVVRHFADSADMRAHVFQEGRKQNR